MQLISQLRRCTSETPSCTICAAGARRSAGCRFGPQGAGAPASRVAHGGRMHAGGRAADGAPEGGGRGVGGEAAKGADPCLSDRVPERGRPIRPKADGASFAKPAAPTPASARHPPPRQPSPGAQPARHGRRPARPGRRGRRAPTLAAPARTLPPRGHAAGPLRRLAAAT